MASEDSGCLPPMHPPVPAASVHGDRQSAKRSEPSRAQVLSSRHRPNDPSEHEEVLLLRAQEGLRLEERDDLPKEILTSPHDVDKCPVARPAMILSYPSAADPFADQVEDLTPLRALTDMELRHELPTGPRARVPLDGHVEGSFSVDVARDVGIQPFLLIGRTRRIFTAHARKLAAASDMASSDRMLGFSSI